MQLSLRNLIIGFFAGTLAVLFFHQTLIAIYTFYGVIPGKPWNNAIMGPFGVPTIINSMFWGGVWGIVYSLFGHHIPARFPLWVKGVILGILGPMLAGWFLIPFIKNTPYMAGGVPSRMFIGATINVTFGIGLVWFICLINSRLKA